MEVSWIKEYKNSETRHIMYVDGVRTDYIIYQDFFQDFNDLYYSHNFPEESKGGQTFKRLKTLSEREYKLNNILD